MNDERRPARTAAATTQPPADDNAAVGGSRVRLVRVFAAPPQARRLRVPTLLIEIPYEGRARLSITGARDETDAAPLRAWLETDPEMAAFCRLARRLRDRIGAA